MTKLIPTSCRHIIVIGGNHDSPTMLNAPRELLKTLNVHVIGCATENIEDEIKANAGKYRPPAKKDKTVASSASGSEETKADEELAGPNKQLLKYCDSQRNNLAQLKKNFRNVWIDIKGNKTSLNQEQRKAKVATLQKQINEDCSEVKVAKKS